MNIHSSPERRRRERASALLQPDRTEKEPHRLEQLRRIVDSYWESIIQQYENRGMMDRVQIERAASLLLLFPERKDAFGIGSTALWERGQKALERKISSNEEDLIHTAALLVQLYPEQRATLQKAAQDFHVTMYLTATAEELEDNPTAHEAQLFLQLWVDYITLFPEQKQHVPAQFIRDHIIGKKEMEQEFSAEDVAALRILMPDVEMSAVIQSIWHNDIEEGIIKHYFDNGKRGILNATGEGIKEATSLAVLVADAVDIDVSGVHLYTNPSHEAHPALPERSII